MASPQQPKQEDEKELSEEPFDDDENDVREDGSHHSEQSYRSNEDRSNHSGDDRSYRSSEASRRSGDGSRSGKVSYRSSEGSFRSGEESNRSGEGSFRSGEGSHRSGERSFRSGEERSHRSGEDGSYRSGNDRSYISGEGSFRSGEERSHRSGEDRSYKSGEDRSYISGEGSYQDGEGSIHSGKGSYRSGKGSVRSGEGSHRSGERSYRSGERSYRSGDGSYRSGRGSSKSDIDAQSFADDRQGSFRRGEGSHQSSQGERSFHDEDDSFKSSQHSGLDNDRSFHDDTPASPRKDGKPGPLEEQSFYSGDESYDRSRDSRHDGGEGSYYSSDGELQSFGEAEHNESKAEHNESTHEISIHPEESQAVSEDKVPQISPTAAFQNSKMSIFSAATSGFGSEVPSFAEETEFSPFDQSPKKSVNAPPIIFENAGFEDDFGKLSIAKKEEGETEKIDESNGTFGNDDFSKNAFEGDAFGDGEDGFTESGTDAFTSDTFGGNATDAFASTESGFECNAFADSAFGSSKSDQNDTLALDAFGKGPDNIFFTDDSKDEGSAGAANLFGTFESGEEAGQSGDDSEFSRDVPAAGESTSSFAQEAGDGTEPERLSGAFGSTLGDTYEDHFSGDASVSSAAEGKDEFGSDAIEDGLESFPSPDQNEENGATTKFSSNEIAQTDFDGGFSNFSPKDEGKTKISIDEQQENDSYQSPAGSKPLSERSGSNGSYHSPTGSQNKEKPTDDVSFYSEREDGSSIGSKGKDESYHSQNELKQGSQQGSQLSFHSSFGSSVPPPIEVKEPNLSNHSRDPEEEHRSESVHSDSYRSQDEPRLSGEQSYYSDDIPPKPEDGSFRSGEASFYSDDRSKQPIQESEEKSFYSEDGSRKSGEASFRSGEDSYRSGERSNHHGDGNKSHRSGEGSYRSGEGSYISPKSEDGSFRSGEASFYSDDRSKQPFQESEEKSFHSEDDSGEASFRSGEDSYRSGEGSNHHGDGNESHRSGEGSYRSGEGSYTSPKPEDGSFRSGEASFYSDDRSKQPIQESEEKSFHSEDGSRKSGEASFRSGEDSYRSGVGSNHHGDGNESHRSGEGSYRSGEGSYRSEEGSFRSREDSYISGAGSFRSGEESHRSGEGSYRSKEESHRSGKRSDISAEGSHRSGEEYFRTGEELLTETAEQNRSARSSQLSGSRSQSSGESFAEEDSNLLDQAKDAEPDPEQEPIAPDQTEDDNASQYTEESMGIGDVFGQPNELFEANTEERSKEGSRNQASQKSEITHDYNIGDGSKYSAPDHDGSKTERSMNNTGLPSLVSAGVSLEDLDSVHNTPSIVSQPQEGASEPEPRRVDSKPRDRDDTEERRKKKKKKKKRRKEAKSQALLDLVANVNDAMLDLEEKDGDTSEAKENNMDTSAHRLLHGFDALLGIFLQLSDELELISTFAKVKKKKEKEATVPVQALKAVLSFAATLDSLFDDLKPIILDCFEEEPDEDMDDLLYRLNSLVDLLCETTHRVGEKQEWNERAETTYVTLLELMEREAIELISYADDVDTPEQGLSANIHEAWSATGHIEELRALQYASDPWLFRQICYEVMVSTDQWCPDTTILMEICGIDPSMLEEEPDPEYLDEDELAPIPQAAEHVLDKINGEALPRTITLASILRRILPPRAVTDPILLDNFTSIRNTIQNPLGLSATNIVSISSVPEQLNDTDALGVGGMGKTTLAAMVAQHPDVRRYFIDGVVWVYVGDKELNYNRYTQCLRELVAQLDFYQGVPLFAELLHTPGETVSKRRRREEGFMIYARDTIAELLHDRSVLIILDDVCFEPDLDWFDFAPMPGESQDDLDSNCALLVTTRCRTLLPAADTVEVDMLDEADAISLLIQESGQLSHTLMAESREARSVVRECANHPLAVKSVGRWLNLKHATAGVVSSVEEIHSEVIKSMDKILKGGDHTGTDMMYEILSMSLSPAINGEPTSIIKFCLAAFIVVFCDREYISDFALTEPTPIIPMDMAELLFETLLEMNESSLLQKGSLFYAQKKEAAVLIPEALSALGVLKVITYSDAEEEENPDDEQKFLQVMHFIHHEYGEYLCAEEEALKDLTKDAERQWNRALVESYLSQVQEWDMDLEDAAHSYALEMIISHMIRGGMYSAAADLLADKSFVRGRLLSLGRENSTRRHIKDCEMLFKKLKERRPKGSKLEPRTVMKQAYQALGSQLSMEDEEQSIEDSRIKDVEVARAHYEIGFSLAEKRCWDAAIAHWETSQELLVSALGTVEVVAGILFNIGVVYSEMNEYEQALDSLKQCLRIRGMIHGEDHILYAQTIQRIGDIFLGMSDYHEAMESYNWALDVMYTEPSHHRVEIGEILDNKGTIHYSKGEIEEALQCHQEALRSKQVDLGEDHPELAATYHHIGNCLADQGNVDDAIVHFEEAIRLMELDPEGGPERDAEVLTIEGILHNLESNQELGLECYEKSLQILVTKVPHRKEKVASLLHLIGCVYLMSGEQKKAMKLFEESLQARRKVLGFVHLDVASTLFNMAFLHQTRNRLDKALKCLEEALKIRQLRLPDSEKVAVTHEKIGSQARTIGKTKKAQIHFEDALRIRRLLHGEQHEAVATVLQELGDLMDDIGEYDSAMSYYIDALDIRRNRLGLDDVAVAETLYSMGYTLHNNDEPDRALTCFEESLSIRQRRLGEDSREVGDTLNMMGFLKAKRGQLDDALTLLWDALRIRKLQEDHVKVSETLKNIGNVHREKQEQELAVECYEECLRIRRTELGPDHEKVADAHIAMGNVQSDMGRTDEAMRSYQEALKIRTLVFGEHDESVAAVLQSMGTMEFQSANHEKARDLLTEFIRIRRDNNTKNDGDYVNVLFMIGNIHKMQGNEEDAQVCWSEAYQVFQELGLAESNPQIAKVMNHLLKVEVDKEEAEQKKKSKGSMFGKMTEKLKGNLKEEKIPGKKRRKGKGIQL